MRPEPHNVVESRVEVGNPVMALLGGPQIGAGRHNELIPTVADEEYNVEQPVAKFDLGRFLTEKAGIEFRHTQLPMFNRASVSERQQSKGFKNLICVNFVSHWNTPRPRGERGDPCPFTVASRLFARMG